MSRYKFKYRGKRFLVKWYRWRRSIDSRLEPDKAKLTLFEEKAIRLWRMCLKDKETKLAYNSSGIRQLEKEDLFMIFKPSGNSDYIITIMDITTERKNVYEIHIPSKHAGDVCDYFDIELEKRMRETENAKRSILVDDLDRLLDRNN